LMQLVFLTSRSITGMKFVKYRNAKLKDENNSLHRNKP